MFITLTSIPLGFWSRRTPGKPEHHEGQNARKARTPWRPERHEDPLKLPLEARRSTNDCLTMAWQAVWPDLAKFWHFGKRHKSSANFWQFISFLQNAESTFANLWHNWANFNLLQMAKDWKIIWSHCWQAREASPMQTFSDVEFILMLFRH